VEDKDGDLKRKKNNFINKEDESGKIPDFICSLFISRIIVYKAELVLAAA